MKKPVWLLMLLSLSGFGASVSKDALDICAEKARACYDARPYQEWDICELEYESCKENSDKVLVPVAECAGFYSYKGGYEFKLSANRMGQALLNIRRYRGPDGDGQEMLPRDLKGVRRVDKYGVVSYVFDGFAVDLGSPTTLNGETVDCQ